MRTTTRSTVITAVLGAIVLVACTSRLDSFENVGAARQALSPTLFDLPNHGEPKVRTGFRSKPGAGGGTPTDPAFCFFMRIKGPFHGAAPYEDGKNEPAQDTFVSIQPVDGEWVGEISTLAPTPEVTIGCVPFKSFLNAGRADTEGATIGYAVQGQGAVAVTTGDIPSSGYRTPSFCTLNYLRANFIKPYANCTDGSSVSLVSDVAPDRKEDTGELIAKGFTCDAINYPWWCLTCPDDQPRFQSRPFAVVDCNTSWSGMPGAGLMQLALTDFPSLTGTGSPLIPEKDGVCWISGINHSFDDPNAEATISVKILSGKPWWFFTSTANGSASATCVLLDQSQ